MQKWISSLLGNLESSKELVEILWKGDTNPNINAEVAEKGGKKVVLGSQNKRDLKNGETRWRSSPPE